MKVGDLVKYERWHTGLQDRTGLVIDCSQARFYHGRVLVLWSNAHPPATAKRWDWVEELRIVK